MDNEYVISYMYFLLFDKHFSYQNMHNKIIISKTASVRRLYFVVKVRNNEKALSTITTDFYPGHEVWALADNDVVGFL